MLTVKLVGPGGDELMYAVERVWAHPVGRGEYEVGWTAANGRVTSETSVGADGTVYVMNEAGKTIARYSLPATPEYRDRLTGKQPSVEGRD